MSHSKCASDTYTKLAAAASSSAKTGDDLGDRADPLATRNATAGRSHHTPGNHTIPMVVLALFDRHARRGTPGTDV